MISCILETNELLEGPASLLRTLFRKLPIVTRTTAFYMDVLKEKGIIFDASVTVTTENIREVSSESFINMLSEKGCKAVIFVEFVPVSENSEYLAPGDKDREYLKEEIMRLRREHEEMVFVSFPGDEKSSGGCIAAGRVFCGAELYSGCGGER